MDAVSYSHSAKQAQRIEKVIANPDSSSGIVTVPKVIASGENITIPAGRVAILPNVQVDGVLNVMGEVFVPSGSTYGDLDAKIALKANINSPVFTGTPSLPTGTTAVTQTAGDNSTKLATTAYVDGKMVLSTAVTASGTAIDFTSIPSWVKRITVMFNGVSTNGASSAPMIQLGISSGVENTGYNCTAWNGTTGSTSITSGFHIVNNWSTSITFSGQMIISNFGDNSWVESSMCATSNNYLLFSAGKKTLSGTLDRIRITTVNGTDTFDAGSINIIYEG